MIEQWIVPAVVIRVIDGDTIEVVLDLGWKLYKNDHVRFAGINAPEKNTPEGLASKAYLSTILKSGDKITIHSRKLDKYGRCLATIYSGSPSYDVNQAMIDAGHAVPYMVNK